MTFSEVYAGKKEKIEQLLVSYQPQAQAEDEQSLIFDAMAYSLMAGGKRLRPMLMAETYRLFGGEFGEAHNAGETESDEANAGKVKPSETKPGEVQTGEANADKAKKDEANADAVKTGEVRDGEARSGRAICAFMAAIEMIHTYSLVHDDLPAMDDDDYRRGRKTTHVVYGEAMGILAGDALLNYAFETACTAFAEEPESSERIGRALSVLAKKAGVFGMIGGQTVDVLSEGKEISAGRLDFIYRLKTGALIEAAMMTGAILAGADETEVSAVEEIAAKIGMAFQIQDDILDVEGSAAVLGKPIGSDEKNHKTTYVTKKGMAQAKKDVKRLTDEALILLEQFPAQDDFLKDLLTSLVYREK